MNPFRRRPKPPTLSAAITEKLGVYVSLDDLGTSSVALFGIDDGDIIAARSTLATASRILSDAASALSLECTCGNNCDAEDIDE